MPSRNTLKVFAPDSYYHIYNRGVEKRTIFLDDRDYRTFLSYFKVALSPELKEEYQREALSQLAVARLRRLKLDSQIELLAYCLMPNHFHLLIYQKDRESMSQLMRSIMTGYVLYFNKRYKRVGPLFQGTYKASRLDTDAYLWHISRYIHLNSKDWEHYTYSSLPYYLGERKAEWVTPKRVINLHNDYKQGYLEFLHDWKDYRSTLGNLESELANM